MNLGLALVDDLRGRLLLLSGDHEAAAKRLQECLRMMREAGAEDNLAEVELTLAGIHLEAGDLAAARAAAERAAAPLRSGGDRVELFQAEAVLARIDALEGKVDAAQRRLSAISSVAAAAENVDLRGDYLAAQAAVAKASGRPDEARAALAEAHRVATASGRGSRSAG